MPLVKPDQKYTYQDYLTWEDDERWELIDGIPYNMSPGASSDHQTILLNLIRKIDSFLQGHPCRMFIPPYGVVLSEHDVVQPDLIIVCDKNQITKNNCVGAPDVIVEIISPNSGKRDRLIKRNLYEKFGVKEYVLIDPDTCLLECYRLSENGTFDINQIYSETDEFRSFAIDGLTFPLKEIFEIE